MPEKMLPFIDVERCIGCGHCVLACILDALKLVDGKSKIINPEACDSEALCVAACPQKAIPYLKLQRY
ncbi:MAG: ATP-binding protein [Promethearchaeota archaeon]|jgi:MinD superfamily P-loop ATPase